MSKPVIHIIILAFIIGSCASKSETADVQNEIEIGEYSFQFPQGFKLIPEQGIDSYVGKISDGKIDFQFDYGYYSNSLDKSIREYLSQEVWKWNALGKEGLLSEGDVTDLADRTELINYTTRDSIQYNLFFLHASDTIEYELTIPEEMQKTTIEIDTVDAIVYKFVSSDNHVGLYAKNLKNFNASMNGYKALSIIATNLNSKETEFALEIVRSCKRKTTLE